MRKYRAALFSAVKSFCLVVKAMEISRSGFEPVFGVVALLLAIAPMLITGCAVSAPPIDDTPRVAMTPVKDQVVVSASPSNLVGIHGSSRHLYCERHDRTTACLFPARYLRSTSTTKESSPCLPLRLSGPQPKPMHLRRGLRGGEERRLRGRGRSCYRRRHRSRSRYNRC